ncbi:MAG: energy-coupling factor ABC transporter ATP-binding protein [Anaerolineales bacterium]|nr:energy-coupling factor ABC transporter ATP-binding protein [Anaerolineales bacterium]
MIHIENLSIRYNQSYALRDISLDISAGECVLVTGPSGCGKSTLARALCGLTPHAIPAVIDGRVEIAGLDTQSQPIAMIAQKVGMVFQRPASQLFHLRVEDEVAFGPRNLGLPEDEVSQRTEWALKATGMYELRESRPTQLSGGQKQCLAIAAALSMRPQVLVLDEPTASLDVPNTRRVMDTLASLRAEYNITIVLIEHRLAEAVQLVDRVVLMEDGRIVSDGQPQVVFADRELRDRLGLRRPTKEPSNSWDMLIQANGNQSDPGQYLLAFEGVSAGFNGHAIIQNIDLQLYPGEFVALVGDNGAGKTTLAMVAAGLIKPQTGKVRFAGGARPRPGLDVALLFQDPQEQLFTDSVDEEIAFASQNYDRFDPEYHQQILHESDLWGLRERHLLELSVGQQQRAALAACLGLRPRLLILDEPTLGQDWGHLQRLMNYLRALNQLGMTILLISHDYKLVYHYAKRVFLLKEGRLERVGKLE